LRRAEVRSEGFDLLTRNETWMALARRLAALQALLAIDGRDLRLGERGARGAHVERVPAAVDECQGLASRHFLTFRERYPIDHAGDTRRHLNVLERIDDSRRRHRKLARLGVDDEHLDRKGCRSQPSLAARLRRSFPSLAARCKSADETDANQEQDRCAV